MKNLISKKVIFTFLAIASLNVLMLTSCSSETSETHTETTTPVESATPVESTTPVESAPVETSVAPSDATPKDSADTKPTKPAIKK